MGYGYKYCSKFKQYQLTFATKAQLWVDNTLKCLKSRLIETVFKPNKYDCAKIKTLAFDSHPECYVNNGFCELFSFESNPIDDICKTLKGLWQVYELKTFAEVLAWKQVQQTLQMCKEKGQAIDIVKMAEIVIQCGLSTSISS